MPAQTAPAPSPRSRSFAGVLAGMASPEKKFPPATDFDGLADDIATLSYEHALRTHSRYRTAEPASPPPPDRATRAPSPQPLAPAVAEPRKCASVTVRLTPKENDRLRSRAAEAGMTISAYLRSCAFEVESLRAEVKQTLSAMRTPAQEPRSSSAPFWSRLSAWRRSR